MWTPPEDDVVGTGGDVDTTGGVMATPEWDVAAAGG